MKITRSYAFMISVEKFALGDIPYGKIDADLDRRGEAESEGVIERFHGYAIPGTTSNRSLGGSTS
ncbi:hypothetical protein V1478_009264 [Vespula squamosa]|uniref:Uncharacterized protein n=1 Tax=Vespula squamosa TaxID=30214 RepID=A0ABD2AP51_VESSQ